MPCCQVAWASGGKAFSGCTLKAPYASRICKAMRRLRPDGVVLGMALNPPPRRLVGLTCWAHTWMNYRRSGAKNNFPEERCISLAIPALPIPLGIFTVQKCPCPRATAGLTGVFSRGVGVVRWVGGWRVSLVLFLFLRSVILCRGFKSFWLFVYYMHGSILFWCGLLFAFRFSPGLLGRSLVFKAGFRVLRPVGI